MNYSKILFPLILLSACFRNYTMVRGDSVDDGSDSNSTNGVIFENFSWDCANNASCINSALTSVIKRYERREPLDFGLFSIRPIPKKNLSSENHEARGYKVLDFLNSNAVKFPIGPFELSIQRSDDYADYIELALLRSSETEGEDEGRRRNNRHHTLRDKKHMQVFIPMFLLANAVGWMMLAVKAVGFFTLKAFLVSKLAFLVAAGVIVKKLMESASEKMMLGQYADHPESYMMPYNMEYAIPAMHGPEGMSASDIYSLQMAAAAANQQHDFGGHQLQGAESSLSHAVEVQNATAKAQQQIQQQMTPGMQAAAAAAALQGAVAKVKREDSQWSGIRKKPLLYNYLTQKSPIYVYRKF